jgi:hypothetical protein
MRTSDEQNQPTEPLIDGELIEFDDPPMGEPGNAARGALSTNNRRRFDRVACTKSVRVTEMDGFGNPTSTWDCRIVDLSRGGTGLRSRRMIHTGRSVIIEVPGVDGATKVLYGVVRQCRYAEGEGYAVGVEFRALPAGQGIRQWLAGRGLPIG